MGKVGGVLVMSGSSPRVMSPTMGMSSHILSPGTPTPENLSHLPSPHDCKLEDITSVSFAFRKLMISDSFSICLLDVQFITGYRDYFVDGLPHTI